ncbi:30S ribosomal protein S9 [Candidatus Gracilibacteria bacterium]|nr:30S ribosomal protein S9 [Candidatus Gracilibacteria bacterium]
MAQKYTYSTGKKKTASAQVRLFEGKGDSTINGLPLKDYVTRSDLFEIIFAPLKLTKLDGSTYFSINVSGSGESSQAHAIAHGLARALVVKDESHKPVLKAAGMMTRDARKVERKKPGLKKARKSPSWSKR